ncbi:Glutathione S-transferase [Trachymyrmex cornetzi]|uniref:glutathione transferase n=1 Tax=Trachymyrmex cornetzi TaxID=471704 RepID=A0A151JS56_9HYME|nr:Glutathione S-transferase [Trachymyrmex cornetzi]
MPTYKLIYFDVTGLGEAIRFMLNYCGIKFEDVRFSFDEWSKYKPNMPMGQVPVLEIDGKQYHQSRAIGRFLAKKANLYGSNDFEAMEIDATVDSIEDIRQAMTLHYWEQDPAFKAKLKDTLFQKLPMYLDVFEAQVKKNGGYLVGGKKMYKLLYFNVTGLGESIRFLLNQCGIKFEDVRFTSDDWPKHKPNVPMGQVPVLEIDGKQYHQSRAIGRFLAKKGNLYGSDDFEAMEIDATIDSMDDIRLALSQYYWEKDPAFKEKLKETAFQKLPYYLDKFEAQVKKNGGYFVGGKLSWADLLWAAYFDYLSFVLGDDPNKDHSELKKLVEKVRALPNIKAYIEKRPTTQM